MLLFVSVSIYYAFIVNAYSRDLRNKRRSVNSQTTLNDSFDYLKNPLNRVRGMKSQNVFYIQELALHNVSEDLFKTAHCDRKHKKKKSTKRKNKKHSIASTSNGSLRFQENTSDSNHSSNEREKYEHDDHNKHGDRNIHDGNNKQEDHNERDDHN